MIYCEINSDKLCLLATRGKSVAAAVLIPAVPGMFVDTVMAVNVLPSSTETAQ